MKGRAIKLLNKIHEFLVAVGTFSGLGIMIFLTLARANDAISNSLFLGGMVTVGIITYLCILQIEKHFDGEEWK